MDETLFQSGREREAEGRSLSEILRRGLDFWVTCHVIDRHGLPRGRQRLWLPCCTQDISASQGAFLPPPYPLTLTTTPSTSSSYNYRTLPSSTQLRWVYVANLRSPVTSEGANRCVSCLSSACTTVDLARFLSDTAQSSCLRRWCLWCV